MMSVQTHVLEALVDDKLTFWHDIVRMLRFSYGRDSSYPGVSCTSPDHCILPAPKEVLRTEETMLLPAIWHIARAFTATPANGSISGENTASSQANFSAVCVQNVHQPFDKR